MFMKTFTLNVDETLVREAVSSDFRVWLIFRRVTDVNKSDSI
jgi:hypothetical protein